MAKDNPFNSVFSGGNAVSSRPEYVSPFTSLDTSKWVDKPLPKAKPKPKAKGNVDKVHDFLENNKVARFLDAAGERFGTNLVRDAAAIPELARFAKPILPSRADKTLDDALVKYRSAVAPGLKLDQKTLDKSKAGDTFGTGVTIANDVAGVAAGLIEGGASAAKVANKIAAKTGKGERVADTLNKIPWSDKSKVTVKPDGRYELGKKTSSSSTYVNPSVRDKYDPEKINLRDLTNPAATAGDASDLASTIASVQAPPTERATTPTVKAVEATIKKGPNKLQRIFQSTSGELSKQGESGKAISDGLRTVRDNSELAQASFTQKIPSVLDLKNKEFGEFVDALDNLSKGKEIQTSGKVASAIEEWRTAVPAVRQAAEKAGIDVGDLGEFYFPKDYSKSLGSRRGLESAANHLVKTGQAKDFGEALKTLESVRKRYGTRYGHFENSRTVDLPEYDKSKNAVVSYISSAFDRVAHAEQFGAKGEKAQELIANLATEGHDAARAFRNYSIASGTYNYDQPVLEGFSKGARSFNRLRALGLSAILNIGQTTNTATVTGLWNTAKGAMKLLSKSERQYVKDTGVILDSVLHSLREQTGVSGKVTDKLTAPGFNTVERFNRSIAAEAFKSYADGLAKRAAKGDKRAEKALREKLGVKGAIGKKLNKDQQIMASRRGVERAQFKVDAQDLPGWADSPAGKLVAQFKTFTYKQTKFMYDEVLKEAAKGNPAPLARFLAVGSLIGYGTGQVRGSLRGEGKPFDPEDFKDVPTAASELLQALSNVGAFGFANDARFLAEHRESPNLPRYLAGTFGGVTAGLAAETAQNVSAGARGDFKPLGRQVASDVPIAGPALSTGMFPYEKKVSTGQQKVLEQLPEAKREVYQTAFDDLEGTTAQAKQTRSKVKQAVINGELEKAGRLTDEHNAKIEKTIADLERQTGSMPPELYDYFKSTYEVNYDYYRKNANRLRAADGQ